MTPAEYARVGAARGWLGTPYRHQASLKGHGADCLGLVRGVWRETAGEEPEATPPYCADWAEVGGAETLLEAAARWLVERPVEEMRPGDVLLFRMADGAPVKHCAILSELGPPEPRMVHAYWGRFRMDIAERGLPRIARTGPGALAPGGASFTDTHFEMAGLHGRPWSPASLRVAPGEDGLMIGWLARVRLGGDLWDLEPVATDPARFRVRVTGAGGELRAFEVEATSAIYGADDLAEDFPAGPGADATIHVAQFGAGFGWGAEASTPLIV